MYVCPEVCLWLGFIIQGKILCLSIFFLTLIMHSLTFPCSSRVWRLNLQVISQDLTKIRNTN